MRDGTYVGQYPIEEISIDELIKLMVGRSMENRFPANEHVVQPNACVLKVENFSSADPHSFKVCPLISIGEKYWELGA